MRVKLKPAAASAAGAFLLLLLFDLTWPGHGIWLLVVGLLTGLLAAFLWRRDRFLSGSRSQTAGRAAPFSDVGAFGLAWTAMRSARREASGVPLAALLAPVAALAILLFIGGALGADETPGDEPSTSLEQNVSVIDRSQDGQATAFQVNPPNSSAVQRTVVAATDERVSPPQSTTTNQASTEAQQSTAPVRPIVVAAPKAASPTDDEREAAAVVPESANTFEYTVEEGDTLYDIAARYNSTVEVLMNLNQLDASGFIHPGDVLLIPIEDEAAEES